jgi:hypothetical protein
MTKYGFLLVLRTLTYGVSFLLTALIFYLLGSENILIKASPWWPIYGLLANFLCFLFIRRAIKNENIKLIDIINIQRDKLKKDAISGIVFILLSILISVSGSILFGFALYGRFPNELMLSFNEIPTVY